METPVDEVGAGDNALGPKPRAHRVAILLTTTILGPMIGGLPLAVTAAVASIVSSQGLSQPWDALGALVAVIALSYVVAWPFALAAGAANAVVIPLVPNWLVRILAAFAIGFAATFIIAAIREGHYEQWFPLTRERATPFLVFGLLGAAASAICVGLVDHFTWPEPERGN